MQHRGAPPGFLRTLDEQMLGFVDFRGNRQFITLGNLVASDWVALFLMGCPGRRRLKIFAHAEVKTLRTPEWPLKLRMPICERGSLFEQEADNGS